MREKAIEVLSKLSIQYELVEHKSTHSIDETKSLDIMKYGQICKNLFLRDSKGENHYIIVMRSDIRADIKAIASQLNVSKLGFASENRLQTVLNIQQGAVSPLNVINDKSHNVVVVFDNTLKGNKKLGMHPNDNTATVWIDFSDLQRVISHYGNPIRYIDI